VADPGPIITTLWLDQGLDSCLELDGVITVVDMKHVLGYLADPSMSDDVSVQIGYADRLLLNKIDLVSEEQVNYDRNMLISRNT
jgi:G3E family GTPase